MAWGIATLCSARASRRIGASSTLAWVALIGLVVCAPFAAAAGTDGMDASTVRWLAVSGVGYIAGLLFLYAALRRGSVGLIAPIASTEGAVAAVIAIVAGEPITVAVALVLVGLVAGVVLTTLAPDPPPPDGAARPRTDARPVFALAGLSALALGLGLYAGGLASETAPVAWTAAAGRVAGIVLVTLPLVAARRLASPRPVLDLLAIAAVAEVVGYVAFAVGARDSVSIAAVLASQFATVAAVGGYLVLGERLSRIQRVGVAGIATGVAVLAALRAG